MAEDSWWDDRNNIPTPLKKWASEPQELWCPSDPVYSIPEEEEALIESLIFSTESPGANNTGKCCATPRRCCLKCCCFALLLVGVACLWLWWTHRLPSTLPAAAVQLSKALGLPVLHCEYHAADSDDSDDCVDGHQYSLGHACHVRRHGHECEPVRCSASGHFGLLQCPDPAELPDVPGAAPTATPTSRPSSGLSNAEQIEQLAREIAQLKSSQQKEQKTGGELEQQTADTSQPHQRDPKVEVGEILNQPSAADMALKRELQQLHDAHRPPRSADEKRVDRMEARDVYDVQQDVDHSDPQVQHEVDVEMSRFQRHQQRATRNAIGGLDNSVEGGWLKALRIGEEMRDVVMSGLVLVGGPE